MAEGEKITLIVTLLEEVVVVVAVVLVVVVVVAVVEAQFKECGRGGPEELSFVGFKPLLIKEIITAAADSGYEMIGVFFCLFAWLTTNVYLSPLPSPARFSFLPSCCVTQNTPVKNKATKCVTTAL